MSAVPDDLGAWLTESLAPAWAARAADPGRPGYLEVIDAAGRPDLGPRRTTLVTARLVYAFSHAACLSPRPDLLAAARHGLDFLLHRCRAEDGAFLHAVTADGTPLDRKTDLYDLAFVLFGLAWHHRATGDPEAPRIAEATMGFIETRLAAPEGGFLEDSLGTRPRRQNPHMHLLEACHAWAEATGTARWLARADALVALLHDRLLDRAGTLGEFFTDDWRPAPGAAGRRREPGHHCEWTWLLHAHARLSGDERARSTADRLHGFALAHGVARMPDGLPILVDGVDPNGRVVAATRLLWPQTEALKADVARHEAGDSGATARIEDWLALIFRHYVDAGTGLWHNQLSVEGEPLPIALPTRVLYHLVLAVAEAARARAPSVRPASRPGPPRPAG